MKEEVNTELKKWNHVWSLPTQKIFPSLISQNGGNAVKWPCILWWLLKRTWKRYTGNTIWSRGRKHKCLRAQFSSVQSLSRVWLFATPWIAARQASLSITNSWSSLRLVSIESVMPSSHLIFGHPLLLLPPIPPSIKVSSNESTLRMRWPKY